MRFSKALLLAMTGLAVVAQSVLTFEVASIRPSRPGVPVTTTLTPGGRMTYTGWAVKSLVQVAYDIPGFWVSGGPDWIKVDRFDIVAKAEDSPGQEPDSQELTNDQLNSYRARMLRRLQALLTDRFQLQLHHQTKELSGYALVVAKGGPKLLEARDGIKASDALKREDGGRYEGVQIRGGVRDAGGRFLGGGRARGQGATMAMFAEAITRNLAVPVVDKTGLNGKYDFTLEWAPDPVQVVGDTAAPPQDDSGPSLVTAIRQLGLRLESAKVPVETIVIDHVEKPSAN
jgi:uncharacterized protein (TIGR03435 family)